MLLNKVTLTGADTYTDIDQLVYLSTKFPLVEWGILFSYSRMGTSRYPSLEWLTTVVKRSNRLQLSLHLCGRSVFEFINGEPIITNIADLFDRIQLNFNNIKTPIDPFDIESKLGTGHAIITQHNSNNSNLWKEINELNHHILFDASGGQGKLLNVERPLPGKYCGYAGGIGPLNVLDVVKQIEQVVGDENYYIDMESSLRNINDDFCLQACESVLNQLKYNPK